MDQSPNELQKGIYQPSLFDETPYLKTASCVPALRRIVGEWKSQGCFGITQTTRTLLNFWFATDHKLPNGQPFKYHRAQQEAIETLVYLYEVAKIRNRKDLLEKYATSNDRNYLPAYDDFARYCIKMATGSGKTKVISLAIVWQYLNAIREATDDYAKTFLLLAPNVIVFERLKNDFEGGRIFIQDPLVPRELEIFWDFCCIIRGDTEKAFSDGILFLTNIQQLYEKSGQRKGINEEPDIMTEVLGPKPRSQVHDDFINLAELLNRRSGKLLVLNDEAHHTHDEESEWNKVIRNLHSSIPLVAQLDFSATPRFASGGLFPWIIFDYPLKQAMLEHIVKRPVKGIADFVEVKSPVASGKYKAYLTAGVERWREYRDLISPMNKKPLLFIMMNTIEEAEDVGDWLRRTYPLEFGGKNKTLVIHTDTSGEVTKKDLDAARKLAREVDNPHCPTNAIVSVLMLREGWDVRNVTVVVGLRPYTASAGILPEQAIGRGLRLMFDGQMYVEQVDIIGNKAFLSFIDQLEESEDVQLNTFDIGKDKLKITAIMPQLPEKLMYDLHLPKISPILTRKVALDKEVKSLDVMTFQFNPDPLPRQPSERDVKSFRYQAFDILTMERLFVREYIIQDTQRPDEIVSYYAKLIATSLKLPSQFNVIAPKVWEFFENRAFGHKVDLFDPTVLHAMHHRLAGYVVVDVFGKALKNKIIQELLPELEGEDRKLSKMLPFAFSRFVLDARKCVFNLVPCDNEFELQFAKFLESAQDVLAFAKLPLQFGFSIEYLDHNTNLRYYYPDFVVKTTSNRTWLVETKGLESVEVAYKDRAARLWCENATLLTGQQWEYVKVPQKGYEILQPREFADLAAFLP